MNLYRGNLILVNEQHAVREEAPQLTKMDGAWLERRAAVLLAELLKQVGARGEIALVSGWRSHKEQQQIWDNSMREHGEAFTRAFVAVPGHSEHQTGLAIDVGLRQEEIDFLRPTFPYEGVAQIFREAAPRFGFTQRYPEGKEAVTGIAHEPWHFRYVGAPHALIMQEYDWTLEEYVAFLHECPLRKRPLHFQKYGLDVLVSYCPAAREEELQKEAHQGPCAVSGNNVDGYIVTEWV